MLLIGTHRNKYSHETHFAIGVSFFVISNQSFCNLIEAINLNNFLDVCVWHLIMGCRVLSYVIKYKPFYSSRIYSWKWLVVNSR